jgi:glyoxylase-like metal-dependent hydrolase (beta-lactamase superfamily II)
VTGKLSVLLVLLLAATAPASGATPALVVSVADAQKALVREQLGEGLYVFRAPSELEQWTATNSVVIVNDDDVVVFDSCTRAVTARAVIAEIRKLTPKPVRVLVNSHWHQDHWSGNGEYVKAFPGLRIVATAQTRDYMAHMGANFFAAGTRRGIARGREALDAAIKSGKQADGTALTPELRAQQEGELAVAEQFAAEVAALPRLLPNLTYEGAMTFWSGSREFRLLSVTGDATASTVLYLPKEKLLVTGDALVSPEDGNGPPPWTTNSYAITPWLDSLRRLDALDVSIIVPGQGPTMRDKGYLRRTIELFAAVIDQVHAALDRGLTSLADVQAAVNVDAIAAGYPGDAKPGAGFHAWVGTLTKKVMQESLDGGDPK